MAILSDSLGNYFLNIHAHASKTASVGPSIILPRYYDAHVSTDAHGSSNITILVHRTGVVVKTHRKEREAVGKRSN